MNTPCPPFDAARPDGENPSAHQTLEQDGRLCPGKTYTIPARQGRAMRLRKGEVLSVINRDGSQIGDFWAFADGDCNEYLSMEHLRPTLRRISPRPGDALVTNRRRPILTMVEDTSPGVHDTLVASCDIHRYAQLGHRGYHDNCTDNLRMALAAIGLRPTSVPCPLNLWMNTPVVEGGAMEWRPPVSAKGDHVLFRAEMDAVVVISCCPMDLLPINGEDAQPRSLDVLLHREQA
ncbi:urea carboxylase-associated family protein [uncultured Mameliella sp.]|uniref:urea carboxylase-associated family protein n=1 Tax=uncultured Mameliella sp. TaxID=1447087 RepID=UPI00260D3B7C|nr:urea carboxylase-associated family protein [uncultured Mameliella sp.]